MRTATLRRTETGDTGTFGTLEVDGHAYHSGELPWLDNAAGRSCIPAGPYLVRWLPSPKYGHKYTVVDVEGRAHILIHSANLMGDAEKGLRHEVDGCIALGSARGVVDGQAGIVGSRDAVEAFEKLMGLEDFELVITDEWAEAGEVSNNVA